MPKVSIIIPVYNTQSYLKEALESVRLQTLSDIEAIVVDDGSTDGCPGIIDEYARRDKRFKAIRQENSGLHLARAAGVSMARGDYSLFLDSDDTLSADACERLWKRMEENPVDILHFGVSASPMSPEDESDAREFERFANGNIGFLEGASIAGAIFDPIKGYRLDWRTWQRLFPTEFLKRAYANMSPERLGRAEDSHEGLVLAALASTFDSMDEYKGYQYRYGCGVSVGGTISQEKFGEFCRQFHACLDASYAFAAANPNLVDGRWITGLTWKCHEILANDWKARVSEDEKPAAWRHFADEFGGIVAAREMYRFTRDRAYSLFASVSRVDESDELYSCLRLAKSYDTLDGSDADRARLYETRAATFTHLGDIRRQRKLIDSEKEPMRIFVTMHDRFATPDSPMFVPVQVGAGQFSEGTRFRDMLHDGDGESISDANKRYCEMTVQYWAWKNVEAEYYGFCHYRRYFNFSDIPARENEWGEVEADYLSPENIQRFGLDSESARTCMGDADVLLTEIKDVSAFPDHNGNLYEHYRNAPYLHIDDLNTMIDVIADMQPDYLDDLEAYLRGSRSCFCNMYIMRRDAFHEYCEWAFPLLREFEGRCDMSRYSQQEMRVTGHLAERLFNIYLLHNSHSANPWKTKQVQCVRFKDAHETEPLHRAFPEPAVPVVFAADNGYSPILATAIHSLVKNTGDSHFYDIVVLSRGIDARNQRLMQSIVSGHPNVSLRFYNVSRLVEGYNLTVNEHITEETYYRFLIQWILPDYPKVLYLDSDLIVNSDVADLFETQVEDNLLAAVVDVDWAGICNVPGSDRRQYAQGELGMEDPYSYFQAGVLLLNTAEMAKLHTLDEWLALAGTPHIFNDQDVLNAECEGRVTYLGLEWNVLVDTGRLEIAISHAPVDYLQGYLDSRTDPKIIHYAGAIKPWNVPSCDFAEVFWRYARETPFYEVLLEKIHEHLAERDWAVNHDAFLYEQGSRSIVRKIADVAVPYGSRRREKIRQALGRE